MNQTGDGFFTRDVGRLPPSIRNILKTNGNDKIKTVQVWRYPLFNKLTQNLINSLFKQPYDTFWHLGINLNGSYNLDKNAVLKMSKGKEKSNTNENKTAVINVSKDITLNELFDKLRKKMGDAGLTQYSARSNNCQDLVLNVLSVLGITDPSLKTFVKQDTEKVFKKLGLFEKIVETGADVLTKAKQVIDRQQQGEGSSPLLHDTNDMSSYSPFLSKAKIQL